MMKIKLKEVIYKILIIIFIIIFGTLISNKNYNVKACIYKNIYNNTISFAKIKKFYNNYAGVVIPFQDMINETEVFNEKIKYKELNMYDNGIKLTLESNYAIPLLSDGIVIFVGNKKDLNNTVIVEDENGIDYIYGNLDNINVKLYDYVKENSLLGEASDNTLYLLFQKGEEYLDYKEFLN